MKAKIDIPVAIVRCPYCHHKNVVVLGGAYTRETHCCDVEDGGCDQYFFVRAEARVEIVASTHKIEGYSDVEPAHDAEGGAE